MNNENQKDLLIIDITRMYARKGTGNDDFVSSGIGSNDMEEILQKEEMISTLTIHGYTSKFTNLEDNFDIAKVVEEVERSIIRKNIHLKNFKEVKLAYHPESGVIDKDELFSAFIKYKFFKILSKKSFEIESYSGSTNVSDTRLSLFQKWRKSSIFFENLKKYEKRSALNLVKHDLSQIFSPILIDLQGFKDSNFNENYWNEIIKEYSKKGENYFSTKAEAICDILQFTDLDNKNKFDKSTKLLTNFAFDNRIKILDCLCTSEKHCDCCENENLQSCIVEFLTGSNNLFNWYDELVNNLELLEELYPD
jgi:hypothetical protein